MKQLTAKALVSWIDHYLADSRLKPEEQLRKRWAWIWMVVTFIGVLLTVFLFLFILKLWPIWWSGTAFVICYLVAFPIYRKSRRFDLVINVMFSVFIILIFFALLQVGGLSTSLGFVFIGVNCAMGSVLVGRLNWTIGMFTLYCLTIILVGILQPFLETPEYITPRINIIAFVTLTLWVNACILFLVVLFMKDKSRLEKSEADKLKKIDEAKTQLYTNLSHEFRTPLTVINGIAEQLDQNSEKWLKTGPRKIKSQSNILLRLVNQMLDISKIEAGSMRLNFIHGDMVKYINFLIGSFFSLAENKNIELKFSTNCESIYADYDPEKIMQIITNLLSNAIKFTPRRGNIYIDISKINQNEKEIVKISVRDTGKGISQESIKYVFDRFYQAPDKYNETHGTGLGLALARELVKMMNGTIQVKSEVDKGSVFVVTLPIYRKATAVKDHGISLINTESFLTYNPIHHADKGTELYARELSDKPILLLVEDNNDVVEYLVTILEKHYIVELALNGKDGFDKAKEIIPDIILTDVMMPQMDGFELIRCLKKELSTDHIPVVVLTAKGDLQSKISGLEIGVDHYLIKPFIEKELVLKLKNLLKTRQKMQKKLGVLKPNVLKNKSLYRQELLFISNINNLIDQHMSNEDFGIKEICSLINLSRPQLYRKFTALTNISIGKYIKTYRLHKAKAMMENEGKNVSEAAMDSGFKNLSHFSASFHIEFGYPPSELL